MKVKLIWAVRAATVMFKPKNKISTGLILSDQITHCVDWNFSDMADPIGQNNDQFNADVQLQVTQAREEGHATGYLLAKAEFETKLAIEMNAFIHQQQQDNALQLKTLLESAQAGWCSVQVGLADSMMRLVLDMASQVVCHEIDSQYEATLQTVIGKAVENLVNQDGAIIVRLSPSDLSAMQEFLPSRLQERDVKWLTDNNLKTGQCFLESAGQRVDASLSTRLELAKQSIIGDLHKQGANLV